MIGNKCLVSFGNYDVGSTLRARVSAGSKVVTARAALLQTSAASYVVKPSDWENTGYQTQGMTVVDGPLLLAYASIDATVEIKTSELASA